MISNHLLKGVPLFAGLPEQQLAALTVDAKACKLLRHTVVWQSGDAPDGLYIVLAGRVKVTISEEEGREFILGISGPGECLGEVELFGHLPGSTSAKTLGTSHLIRIPRPHFMRCLSDSPELSMRVMGMLARRLQAANEKTASLGLIDVTGRVKRVLLDMSIELDGARVIHDVPKKQQIADMIGASREMVSRVMKHLQNSGHVSVAQGRMLLKNGFERRQHNALQLAHPITQ